MGQSEPEPAAQNPRIVLATAAITVLGTIAVSFVGIVPQLRSGDKQAILALRKEFDEFKSKAATTTERPEGTLSVERKQTINGTVRSDDGLRLLKGHDIYLLPEGNNLLTAKTDDAGKFTMPSVPLGVYSIIVRDSANGQSGKGLLDDDDDEVDVIGAKIRYRIQK